MKNAILSALIACAPLLATAASAGAVQTTGLWQGTYACGQGETGLDARIAASADGAIEATVDFYSTPKSKFQFPRASYRATGELSDSGVLKLTPKSWIIQPPKTAYSVVELQFAPGASDVRGVVVACGKDSNLALHRTSDNPAAPALALAEVKSDGGPVARANIPSTAASEPSGFVDRFKDSYDLISNQIGKDPVIIRGYIKSGPVHRDSDPLCLYNLKSKVLIRTAVYGHATQLPNGNPSFRVTNKSDLDCQDASSKGTLAVVNEIPGEKPAVEASAEDPNANLILIHKTALGKIFADHPYDGTPATYFPKVAVTVIDWSRKTCWVVRARIWHSPTKSEAVDPFGVCWGLDKFNWKLASAKIVKPLEEQKADPNSGNVRNDGPRAPIRALPDKIGIVEIANYKDFLHTMIDATGWLPGAPTNLWVVGFKHEDGFAAPGK